MNSYPPGYPENVHPGQYNNPSGTLPPPRYTGWPETLWTQTRVPFAWGTPVGTTYTYTWKSPIFNLQPLLDKSSGAKGGVPIHNHSARLRVQLFGLNVADGLDDFTVKFAEYSNINQYQQFTAQPNAVPVNPGIPNQNNTMSVQRVTAYADITADVMLGTDQPPSVVLEFEPIGGSTPVWFWQIEIVYTKITSGTPPNFSSLAAYY